MSRGLAERFERFKEVRADGDDRSMEGLEESVPGQVRHKGSDLPESDGSTKGRRQTPAVKIDK